MLYASLNGDQTQLISIADRGLAYGDGCFTTAKILHGDIQLLALHIARLRTSCEKLFITAPNWSALINEITTQAKNHDLAVLKIIITAGTGGRGYARANEGSPNVIVSIHEFPKHYLDWQQQGVTLGIAQTQLGINPQLSGIKHLNRLEQVLVRRELDQCQYDDLLVCDINNNIIETSCANIFWFENDTIYTPDLTHSGVAGLTRELAIKHIAKISQVAKSPNDLANVNAMVICNSVMGCIAVKRFGNTSLSTDYATDFIRKVDLLGSV